MLDDLLSPAIKNLLIERGFHELTETQVKAIPYILKGLNVLIIAPTGSGKTEAALIPVFQLLLEKGWKDVNGIKIVYITPLRSLNRDLMDRLTWWASKLGLRIGVRHADTPAKERRIQTLMPPDMLITTPETFSLLLNIRSIREHLKTVRWVIVDELQELLCSKRGAQLSINLERLSLLSGALQRIGLSAAIGRPEEALRYLVGTHGDGVIVEVDVTKSMDIRIECPVPEDGDYRYASELYMHPYAVARIRRIKELIKEHSSSLIFTNTRPMAEILGSRLHLYDDSLPIYVHHGSLSRDVRIKGERLLKEGRIKSIVCTSSLELGIDIGAIDLVIQYNSPRQATKLIQRVGRSGHWIKRVSKGVILVQDLDDFLESFVLREMALSKELEVTEVIQKPYDVALHEIAGMLIYENRLSVSDLLALLRRSYVYKDLTEDEVKKLLLFASNLPSKILHYSLEGNYVTKPRNKGRLYSYYYSVLSMIPETLQYLVVNEKDKEVIGFLDDEFIALYGEIGTRFIIGGKPWRIVQIFKDKVYVVPDSEIFGAVPTWVGEEIPVSFEVAQRVGRIKKLIEEIYARCKGDRLKFDREVELLFKMNVRNFFDPYYEHLSRDLPLPTDERVLVEEFEDKIVVHLHAGTLVNRSLASYIAYLYSDLYGASVRYSSDSYRLFFQSKDLRVDEIVSFLKDPELFNRFFRKAAEASNIFLWRLIYVAKRMGVISKEKVVDRNDAQVLLTSLRGTVAYEEALRESLYRDFDVKRSLEVIENIRTGKWLIQVIDRRQCPTPILRDFLSSNEVYYEVGRPDRLKALHLLSLQARLLNKVQVFFCIDCLNYVDERKIKNLPDQILCPRCGSTKISMCSGLIEEVERMLDLARTNPSLLRKKAKWKRAVKVSELISNYGKAAAVVLASDSITYKDATEILAIENRVNARLFQLIDEYEKRSLARRALK